MQFVIIGRDGTDEAAPGRRLAARPAHLERFNEFRDKGHMIVGGALLDEQGNMAGSIIVCEFPTREELDEYLNSDPYVVGGVWQEVEVEECRLV